MGSDVTEKFAPDEALLTPLIVFDPAGGGDHGWGKSAALSSVGGPVKLEAVSGELEPHFQEIWCSPDHFSHETAAST